MRGVPNDTFTVEDFNTSYPWDPELVRGGRRRRSSGTGTTTDNPKGEGEGLVVTGSRKGMRPLPIIT